MVSDTESQGLVVRRVRVPRARIWCSERSVDETQRKTLVLHRNSVASRGTAQRLGARTCSHIEVKWLWLQQAMDEKKLSTKSVPTDSNNADIATKGLTSDRRWKLMNLMGRSLVAGVECLVRQPMEKITRTSISDSDMNQTVKKSTRCRTLGSV